MALTPRAGRFVTAHEPSRAEAMRRLGERDFAGALAGFDSLLTLHPGDRDLLNARARALEGLGRLEESLAAIDRCLDVAPDAADEWTNRAVLLTRLARRDEAVVCLERALTLRPNDVDILLKRAVLVHQLGRREEAFATASEAVRVAPRHWGALNTRGMILDDLERRAEALADFEAILAAEPDHAGALTNRGILHGRAGEFREALGFYDRSLSIDPDQPNAVYNRAGVRLVLGDWVGGFRDFEARWAIFPHEAARRSRLGPQWTGQEDLKGKTLLLHHEQGYGDTLQFCRYAPLAQKRGAQVILAVPAALKRLMETLPGAPRVVAEGEPLPAHDYHCPMMSLALAFGTTPAAVPATIGYLRADAVVSCKWSESLGPRRRPRIGLVWSGRRYPPINTVRDMSFELIRPLLALEADFLCLQTEVSARERADMAVHANLTWVGGRLGDFADTAGLIANLDLVIAVDTAVAHLTGAMAKPVWVMNRYASCWRWLLNRPDSPWYPSLRLFRQPSLGDWSSVVADVLKAAAVFLGNRRPPQTREPPPPAATETRPDLAVRLQGALDWHREGRFVDAALAYRQILAEFPAQPDALHYLGIALAQQQLYEDALIPLGHAAALQPDNAAIHTHQGNALAGLSRHAEALVSYDRAIACDPSLSDSHFNRGVVLSLLERREEALTSYCEAVRLDPLHAKALNNQGNVLADMGKEADALAAYDRAIAVRPAFVDAWVNRANLLRRLHRLDEALQAADQAIVHGAGHAEAHNGRGAVLADLGRLDEALAAYEKAIALDPSLSEAVWNKALVQLARGDYGGGWPLYEARWRVKSLGLTQSFLDKPRLNSAEDLPGKTVLLHAEQGYGDTIQFSRYATLVAERGARVILSAPSALQPLLRTIPGVHDVVRQDFIPPFDLQCPLMSLPGIFGTELATIRAKPYLNVPDSARQRWAQVLKAPGKKRLKIGIAWAGKPTHRNDRNRSIPLHRLLPLFDYQARWFSLQRDIPVTDTAVVESVSSLERYADRFADFAETAALIDHLDLLITVDTAVAHVAGALGKAVWVLLPAVADWRWLLERSDSPWYPTARLFRQPAPGDWASVIAQVGTELQSL